MYLTYFLIDINLQDTDTFKKHKIFQSSGKQSKNKNNKKSVKVNKKKRKENKNSKSPFYAICIQIHIYITYLDRRVVGSFITITSVMSPYFVKYSLRLSETIKQFDYLLHDEKLLYKCFQRLHETERC